VMVFDKVALSETRIAANAANLGMSVATTVLMPRPEVD